MHLFSLSQLKGCQLKMRQQKHGKRQRGKNRDKNTHTHHITSYAPLLLFFASALCSSQTTTIPDQRTQIQYEETIYRNRVAVLQTGIARRDEQHHHRRTILQPDTHAPWPPPSSQCLPRRPKKKHPLINDIRRRAFCLGLNDSPGTAQLDATSATANGPLLCGTAHAHEWDRSGTRTTRTTRATFPRRHKSYS